jgi:metal-responsive CopG/Arc/MetJ family transcriptional regulator
MQINNRKLLISLTRELVHAIDAVTTEKQVSRTAFIRESLIHNLHYYNTYERSAPVCFSRDDAELYSGRPAEE